MIFFCLWEIVGRFFFKDFYYDIFINYYCQVFVENVDKEIFFKKKKKRLHFMIEFEKHVITIDGLSTVFCCIKKCFRKN